MPQLKVSVLFAAKAGGLGYHAGRPLGDMVAAAKLRETVPRAAADCFGTG